MEEATPSHLLHNALEAHLWAFKGEKGGEEGLEFQVQRGFLRRKKEKIDLEKILERERERGMFWEFCAYSVSGKVLMSNILHENAPKTAIDLKNNTFNQSFIVFQIVYLFQLRFWPVNCCFEGNFMIFKMAEFYLN